MDDNLNLNQNLNDINENFEEDMKMQQLKQELSKKFEEYNVTMKYMLADAPISVLCLPAVTIRILSDNGLLRIYDLFDVDFSKIEGLGETRIRHLTTSLDQFIAML